ncbi:MULTISPECIES: hypothetical protein [Bacillaceae]|uniref:hypothetical protein n=1 Tax=Bacillaceae TaxID=186817 RepID=UPI000BFC9B36|nr:MULTISPECIES: hypothetical protein [Bacillaceae]PGT77126.1 hypothetical protein COD11_25420 [Bacillus sp. AFS040349]UGB28889.1 hypothetical protein LPC09_14035 [Metabacillus sp. B2-18]
MSNNNKTKSILFLSLMLLMSGFLLAACSNADAEDTNKEAIKKVLEHEFSGPDEKFMEIMWDPKYRTVVNNKEENKELDKSLEEIYGTYFTDTGLDSFIAAFGGTQYLTFAYNSGYKLNFMGVTIEQSEKNPYRYTFIAKVGYQKNGDKEKTANVEGEVHFSTKEEGKIGRFQYGNDNGLTDILRTSN